MKAPMNGFAVIALLIVLALEMGLPAIVFGRAALDCLEAGHPLTASHRPSDRSVYR
jgi:hypothetical protein